MAMDQHLSYEISGGTNLDAACPENREPETLDRLLIMSAAGDQSAFRALYDATSGKLLAQAFAMLRQREAAEDALQDGYIRIWERASAYDARRGPALPWMLRLLRNAVIDRLRRDKVLLRSCDYDDYAREMPAPPAPIDDRLDLADALVQLTPEQRSAIVTVVIQGWTNEQAGIRAGMPEGTSKARVARGLKRMRAFLDLSPAVATAGL